jgi:hypothetical protein
MMRSRSPAGLRSQPHEFNKIIKYLSAPVALLSVHASFKNFADNRVAEIAFADASLRGKLRKVGSSFLYAARATLQLNCPGDACIRADDPNRVLI